MKRLFPLLLILMLLCCAAAADPVITNGTYLSYIGTNNYLYLEDANGGTKTLRAAIVDMLGMNDRELFCLTAEGRVYDILLDGSATTVVSAPSNLPDAPFTLSEGVLTLNGEGMENVISTAAVLAARSRTGLYFIEQGEPAVLRFVSLTDPSAAVQTVCEAPADALCLTASDDAAAIVTAAHTVLAVDLNDQAKVTEIKTVSEETAAAYIHGNKLYCYAVDENGRYTVLSVTDAGLTVPAATQTPAVTKSAQVTATVTPRATATPRPTATATPKKTARPTATATPDDGSIHYGDRGSAVKEMQKRLIELGYPLDKADGVYGEKTLLAVKLFQNTIGYRERSTVTLKVQERLYAKDAPVYDPGVPLTIGDKGIRVKAMQMALMDQGYGPDKADGVYGAKTVAAVKRFQKEFGLSQTGEADRETLELLFGDYLVDVAPTATPKKVSPTATKKPAPATAVPTATPESTKPPKSSI